MKKKCKKCTNYKEKIQNELVDSFDITIKLKEPLPEFKIRQIQIYFNSNRIKNINITSEQVEIKSKVLPCIIDLPYQYQHTIKFETE